MHYIRARSSSLSAFRFHLTASSNIFGVCVLSYSMPMTMYGKVEVVNKENEGTGSLDSLHAQRLPENDLLTYTFFSAGLIST